MRSGGPAVGGGAGGASTMDDRQPGPEGAITDEGGGGEVEAREKSKEQGTWRPEGRQRRRESGGQTEEKSSRKKIRKGSRVTR
jgi:hypothetical protein